MRINLTALFCFLLVGCFSDNSVKTVAPPDATVTPPDIVLIIADDVSKDFSSYDGQVNTPNIDYLAKNGVIFSNAYTTASSCSPSRSSIITGRYPHNHGAPELHMGLPDGQPVFPAKMREEGYYTLAAGKWHMGEYPRYGFDLIHDPGYQADYTGAEYWVPGLKNRPSGQPFFMWFAAFDAHRPWEADPQATPHDPEKVSLPVGIPDTLKSRKDFAHYLDEVRRFDRKVGEVISELKVQGRFENTLLIVTSDNGRPFPRNKTTLYEGGMQIPMIMHWPAGGLAAGSKSEALVSTMDLAPTILEAAGVEIPSEIQGISMLPIAKNPNTKTRDVLFGERNWHTQRGTGRMVRRGSMVYFRDYTPNDYSFQMVDHEVGVYAELLRLREKGDLTDVEAETFSTNRPTEALFDIESDPDQRKNLASSPDYKEEIEYFRTMLAEWQRRTGDSIPPQDEMTPDRADRTTFKRLYQEPRPAGGVVVGEEAGATKINDPGQR